jgi:hypothetical protein
MNDIFVRRLPPGLHGLINLLTGTIVLAADDPPQRQVQALVHELLHDGLSRLGERLSHDDIHTAAAAIAQAMCARGLAITEDVP